MIVLYAVIVLGIFWMAGYFAEKVLKKFYVCLFWDSIIGKMILGLMCITSSLMILGLFLPINLVTVLLCVILGASFIINIKEIFQNILQIEKREMTVCGLEIIIFIIVGLPQILKNELYISTLANNDFAYYIASINWLKEHCILQPVEYSLSHPFNSLAEYMLDYTRIGLDIVGAFFANIFGLEAHEIFPILNVLVIGIIFFVAYEVIYYLSKNNKISLGFAFIAAVSGNTLTLMAKQYSSQLFGVAMLILAFYVVDAFFQKQSRENIILCGMVLSTLFAFYCEFAVYITIYILVYMMRYIVKRKFSFLNFLKMCIGILLINPYGLYKAVKFNLSIFTRVSVNGAQDIDPYSGNMLGIKKTFGCMLGFSDWLFKDDKCHVAIIIVGISIMLACMFLFIICVKNNKRDFVVTVIMVFIILEVYFLFSRGAYQEYKNITSFAVVWIVMVGCIIAILGMECKRMKYLQYLLLGIYLMITMYGIYEPLKQICNTSFTVDSNTDELKEAVNQIIPQNSEVEIDSSVGVLDYMAAVYALRDHDVNLNTDSLSYLQYFQRFTDNDPSEYILYGKSYELFPEEDIIWSNDKYCLVKRKEYAGYKVIDVTTEGFVTGTEVFVSEEADYVVNKKGYAGVVLYGPYAHIEKGTYELIMAYTVLSSTENVGYFDIAIEGNQICCQTLNNSLGAHQAIIKNYVFEDTNNLELRAFVEEDAVIKIEGIKYRRLENEE